MKIFIFLLTLISFEIISGNEGIKLLEEDKKWIKQVKEETIKVHLNGNLEILSQSKEEEGNNTLYEIIDTLEELTMLDFDIVKQKGEAFLNSVDSGEPHIVVGVEDYKRNRRDYFYIKEPSELRVAFITRENFPFITSSTDLSGKTVVYIKGDQVVNEVIKKYGSRITFIQKKSPEKVIESLLNGDSDIYVTGFQEALDYIKDNPVSGIKTNYVSSLVKKKYYIGALPQYKPLLDIIERLLVKKDFNNKVLYEEALESVNDILKTSNEIKSYLEKNENLRVFIPENINIYPGYGSDMFGNREGLIVDYFKGVGEVLEAEIVFEEADSPANFHVNPYIVSIGKEDINARDYLTTEPYVRFNLFIFNREQDKYIPYFESLKKYKIAVQKNSPADLYLRHKGLEKNLMSFDSKKEVIEAVAKGRADVFLGEAQKVQYFLKKYSIKNIKLAGGLQERINLKFGVPKQDFPLYFLINLLSSDLILNEERKEKILEKNIEIIKEFKVSLTITAFSVLGFLVSFVYFRQFKETHLKLKNITLGLVSTLEDINFYSDNETGKHIKRIGEYSKLIAKELKLPKRFIAELELYSSLHDIGKVGVSNTVLKKPGILSLEEFEKMKCHTEIGYSLIKGLGVSSIAENIIRYHHEKWDGSGYGKGLVGEKIPIEARIVAIADVYDALRQKRVYKESFSHKKAFDIIVSESGKHFDPEIVNIFIKKQREFDRIFNKRDL